MGLEEVLGADQPQFLLVGEDEDADKLETPEVQDNTTQSAALQKVKGEEETKPTLPVSPPAGEKAAPPASDEDKYFDKTVKLTVREALRDA